MPALLSRPPRPSIPSTTRPPEASETALRSRPSGPRCTLGLLCFTLALGLVAWAYTPTAVVVFDVVQVGQQATLATAGDLVRRVFPAAPDTASSNGTGAPGQPAACAPGNRDALGQNLVIARDAWICGDVTVYFANVTVLGRVDGGVRAVVGSVVVAGQVSGGVTALGGNVDIQPGARIGGDVQSIGGSVVDQATAGAIQGNVVSGADSLQTHGPRQQFNPYTTMIPWFQLLFWGLAGAGFSLLFPHYVLRVRTTVQRQTAASFVTGIMSLVLGGVVAVALALTCLGIPVALALLAGMWVAWVIGTVALGSWLGNALLRRFTRGSSASVLGTTVGVLLLAGLAALPYVGWPVFAVEGALGTGASVRSYLAARRSRRARRVAP